MYCKNLLHETIDNLKTVRSVLHVDVESSIIEAIDIAIGDLEHLASECEHEKSNVNYSKVLIIFSQVIDKLPIIAKLIETFKQ